MQACPQESDGSGASCPRVSCRVIFFLFFPTSVNRHLNSTCSFRSQLELGFGWEKQAFLPLSDGTLDSHLLLLRPFYPVDLDSGLNAYLRWGSGVQGSLGASPREALGHLELWSPQRSDFFNGAPGGGPSLVSQPELTLGSLQGSAGQVMSLGVTARGVRLKNSPPQYHHVQWHRIGNPPVPGGRETRVSSAGRLRL